jgi:hypothetical protein
VIEEARALVARINTRLLAIARQMLALEDERDRLESLRSGIERFIQQPGDGGAPSVASTTPPAQEHPEQGVERAQTAEQPAASSRGVHGAAPAPESQLEAGDAPHVAVPPADSVEADDHAGEAGYEQPATGERAPGVSSPAASSELPCPECDRTFPRAQALGRHRSAIHGTPSQRATPRRRYASGDPAAGGRPDRFVVPDPEPEPVGFVGDNRVPAAPTRAQREGVVIKGNRERWLCNRCPASFPTAEERDTHQGTHPPVPHVEPMRGASRGVVDQVMNR